MVKRVRVFGHDDPGLWQIHDVSTLVCDCLKRVGGNVGEGIILETSIPAEIGCVRAEHEQIEAAISNLIANAGQAVAPGKGRISVTLSRTDSDSADMKLPPWLRHGPHAVIAVTDNGEGIPPDVQERIFGPFFTTREVGKGTGLGLAIVQGVVATHGGGLVAQQPMRHRNNLQIVSAPAAALARVTADHASVSQELPAAVD